MRRIVLTLILLASSPRLLDAQESALAPGSLTDHVLARGDSTQAFAIYVPPGYDRDRKWPVLFLLDPRGRALVPMRAFQDAAARLGWIVISSYNTASDGPAEPNVRALDAMLGEAQDRFTIDERRIYLAGFSGTARLAWDFALQLPDNIAGVIGIGAGFPSPLFRIRLSQYREIPFVFFGASGITDFNYEEVRALDQALDALPVTHRFEYFQGAHQWLDSATAARALGWLELQAIRRARRTPDRALIDSLHRAWIAHAVTLEQRDPVDAMAAYQSLSADFHGLHGDTVAIASAQRLNRSRSVRQAVETRRRIAARDSAYGVRLLEYLRSVRASREPPSASAVERALEIESLRRDAERRDDDARALAAQRMLERAFVFLAFYEPQAYLESDEHSRAIALLRVARRIKPDHPQVCFMLARALTESGRNAEALEAVECAVKGSAIGAAQLAREPTLAGLRHTSEFTALLERLRTEGRPD